MFRVIPFSKQEEWRNFINKSDKHDFYHTWEYHKLSYENKEGEPILFVSEEKEGVLMLPLMKREIIQNQEVVGYDFTSVYGYAGPVFSGDPSAEQCKSFSENIINYCNKNNIISIFSRLHPLLKQEFILTNLGSVEDNSITIDIDLTKTLEEQKRDYRKSNKSEINKLRRTSTIIWSDGNDDDIDSFTEIYEENMRRVNAKPYYFFSKQYYKNLINTTDYKTKLIFIELEGVKICGVIIVFCDDIIQYHLAGTLVDYLRLAPVKLILDEVRIFGTENNYKHFHLGGGLSNKVDDPLFRFKKGFSKNIVNFQTFKAIINKAKYTELSNIAKATCKNFNKDYFPLYRNT